MKEQNTLERSLKLAFIVNGWADFLDAKGYTSGNDHLDACVHLIAITLARVPHKRRAAIMKEMMKRAKEGAEEVERADAFVERVMQESRGEKPN